MSLRDSRSGDVELVVIRGAATLLNDDGQTALRAGERAFARPGSAPSYAYVYNSASWDAFDRWSDAQRSQAAGVSTQYLPDTVRPYASTFDQYGSWSYDTSYGSVWYPAVGVDWRPYYNGRWASYASFGWTWIGTDAWAWPTHHYGRWGVSAGGRWFWIPGRTWGAAWVSWAYAPGYVSWCPLGWDNGPAVRFGVAYGYGAHYGYGYGYGYGPTTRGMPGRSCRISTSAPATSTSTWSAGAASTSTRAMHSSCGQRAPTFAAQATRWRAATPCRSTLPARGVLPVTAATPAEAATAGRAGAMRTAPERRRTRVAPCPARPGNTIERVPADRGRRPTTLDHSGPRRRRTGAQRVAPLASRAGRLKVIAPPRRHSDRRIASSAHRARPPRAAPYRAARSRATPGRTMATHPAPARPARPGRLTPRARWTCRVIAARPQPHRHRPATTPRGPPALRRHTARRPPDPARTRHPPRLMAIGQAPIPDARLRLAIARPASRHRPGQTTGIARCRGRRPTRRPARRVVRTAATGAGTGPGPARHLRRVPSPPRARQDRQRAPRASPSDRRRRTSGRQARAGTIAGTHRAGQAAAIDPRDDSSGQARGTVDPWPVTQSVSPGGRESWHFSLSPPRSA